ncbi:MAG: hypothetical protein ACD_3C00109G0003 [uncultured bacterium (gcode 4)]|uniref:Ankyrin repeat protein n=1 Tax=uncultured bacterium (gcode 4) TaxID=1234023 RepID=K2GCS8_9BACT|nr:MAG: hypothetical protein ACD_3C00109G0003 [uncultured bacterium (gcode 4)]
MSNSINDILSQLSKPIEELARDAWIPPEWVSSFIDEVANDHIQPVISMIKDSFWDILPVAGHLSWNADSSHFEDLISYLKSKWLTILCEAIENEKNADAILPAWCTSLHFSFVFPNDLSLSKKLLLAWANPNVCGDFSRTALHLWVSTWDIELVEMMLEKWAEPNARDMKWETPLHYAINKKDSKMIELLKSSLKYRLYLGELYEAFETSLNFVSGKWHEYVTVMQADWGDIETKHYWDNLIYNFIWQDLKLVKALIKAWARIDPLSMSHSTPLIKAAKVWDWASAKCLLEAHANINATDVKWCTPSQIATDYWHPEIAKDINWVFIKSELLDSIKQLWFEQNADMIESLNNINAIEQETWMTIVHKLSIASENSRLLEKCLDFWANPNIPALIAICTPLMIAAATWNYLWAEILLKKGADPNITATRKWTSWWVSIEGPVDATQIALIAWHTKLAKLIRSDKRYIKKWFFADFKKLFGQSNWDGWLEM